LSEDEAAIWERRYRSGRRLVDDYDPWLASWRPEFVARNGRALDIGCGEGRDTEVLLGWGFDVTAFDRSSAAVELSRARNPAAHHQVMDIRELGQLDVHFAVVVANLTLHYFDRTETLASFAEIHRLLEPAGLFAFRVDAAPDGGGAESESWARVDQEGVGKQVFTTRKLDEALAGRFRVLSQEKWTIGRHGRPKRLFEVIAESQQG
jgi:SAM-dependent methyltransferase